MLIKNVHLQIYIMTCIISWFMQVMNVRIIREKNVLSNMFWFIISLVTYFVGKIPLRIADENDLKNAHGTLVRKKGTTTGETEGILVSRIVTVRIDNVTCPVKYRFDFCYEIKNKVGSKPFFEAGDSGSGVYLMDNRGNKKPLGIAFAYSINGNTYACKIENVTRAFDLSLYDVEKPVHPFWGQWFKSMNIS